MDRNLRVTASRARVLLTVLGTLAVVGAEFLLLNGVYTRGIPPRTQQIVVAALASELRSGGADPTLVARDASSALDELASMGVSASELRAVRAATATLASRPSDPAAGASLTADVDGLAAHLRSRARSIDTQARIIFAVLLVAASLGWMVWFRRLVTRHRALQQRVTEQQSRAVGEQRLAALVRNASDVVAVCDLDATVTYMSPSLQAVLGFDASEVTGHQWTDLVEEGDRELFRRLLISVDSGEDGPLRARMRHADGRVLHVEGTVTNLVADSAVGGLVITVRDITGRVELEEQLTHQAFHDALTGLANRQLFSDRLSHALQRRSGIARPLVVLFCDLDEFKNVNDSLGHGVGDEVLRCVSQRFALAVRPGDTVARLGGDEFAILMDDTDLAGAHPVAERLLAALAEPIMAGEQPLAVRASIGLASALPGEISGEEVLRNADVAMYLAKDKGKGTIAVYDSDVHAETLDRLMLRSDLQRAIREGELVLHYQPTIDLRTHAIAGFEALVRWEHPTRGLLPPLSFITLAEQSGLIQALGSWVLRTACRAAVELGDDVYGPGSPTMAVNVAAAQLADPGFVDEVMRVLADTGLEPARLTLEITESVLLKDVGSVIDRLAALRDRGIRIAIDDFGTGYSSLAYLRNLPVDVLKVDKSFVDQVTTDTHDAAIAEAILSMSARMNLTTVAEGVEQAEQANWLSSASCSYGQGYLWSRPVPLHEAKGLLSGSTSGSVTAIDEARAHRARRGRPMETDGYVEGSTVPVA